jgi:hypothetical protein
MRLPPEKWRRRLFETLSALLAAAALAGVSGLSHSAHAGDIPTFAVDASG